MATQTQIPSDDKPSTTKLLISSKPIEINRDEFDREMFESRNSAIWINRYEPPNMKKYHEMKKIGLSDSDIRDIMQRHRLSPYWVNKFFNSAESSDNTISTPNMSVLKHSFRSKQSKEFINLSLKAIPSLDADAAHAVYKSVKHNENMVWRSMESAMHCLQKKFILNQTISMYQQIINDTQSNSHRVMRSTNSLLSALSASKDTIQLNEQIEIAFNLQQGSLSNEQDTKIPFFPRKRSRSFSKSTGLAMIPLQNVSQPSPRRSISAISPKSASVIPNMNTKEYLHFLLDRALKNKAWNCTDADILCQCAVSMQCEWITVHSMFVLKCNQLLHKYTLSKYKKDLKKHKKSQRRGSKSSTSDFKAVKAGNSMKSYTKICATIGYPSGQTSTASKVTETAQAVADGAERIRLMVSVGKVIIDDWFYIKHEIKSVIDAAKGIGVQIVFPNCSQITEKVKTDFNRRIMYEFVQKEGTPQKENCRNMNLHWNSKEKVNNVAAHIDDALPALVENIHEFEDAVNRRKSHSVREVMRDSCVKKLQRNRNRTNKRSESMVINQSITESIDEDNGLRSITNIKKKARNKVNDGCNTKKKKKRKKVRAQHKSNKGLNDDKAKRKNKFKHPRKKAKRKAARERSRTID